MPPCAPAVTAARPASGLSSRAEAALGACGKSSAWEHVITCLAAMEAAQVDLNATSSLPIRRLTSLLS